METFSVLLETYEQLPHLDLGEEVAKITGVHTQNAFIRLRRQQGIVWENLERENANALGALLIKHGHSAGLVRDEEVRKEGTQWEVHNGSVTDEGFVIEDPYGRTSIMKSGSILLAQAGWIEEKAAGVTDRYKSRRTRVGIDPYSSDMAISFLRPKVAPIGWVLHIYPVDQEERYVRVIATEFSYSYQGYVEGDRNMRFGMMLSDLSKALPDDKLDFGFRLSMGTDCSPVDDVEYPTIDEMAERGRWLMTMKKLMR